MAVGGGLDDNVAVAAPIATSRNLLKTSLMPQVFEIRHGKHVNRPRGSSSTGSGRLTSGLMRREIGTGLDAELAEPLEGRSTCRDARPSRNPVDFSSPGAVINPLIDGRDPAHSAQPAARYVARFRERARRRRADRFRLLC